MIDYIGKLSPNAILADALSEIDDIDHIVLYVAMKKGVKPECSVSWSRCELRDTAYGLQMIQREFVRSVEEVDGS